MLDTREIAKDFVTSYYKVNQGFFDAAWDVINANLPAISSSAGSAEKLKSFGGALAFGGEEEHGAVKAIIIFADGFKEMPLEGDFSSLVDSIKSACGKYHAEEGLTKEILKKVNSLENRIEKFLKPGMPIKSIARLKEDKEYELLSSGKKVVLLVSLKAEEIRGKRGLGTKNEIFIDDERKDVFVRRKSAEEFKDLMYALLFHFVINSGVGGDTERLYIAVWGDAVAAEDNRDQAVQQAVKRFRIILKNYNLGIVPELSKSRYAASKTYVMKPRPNYCILRRIEKEEKDF